MLLFLKDKDNSTVDRKLTHLEKFASKKFCFEFDNDVTNIEGGVPVLDYSMVFPYLTHENDEDVTIEENLEDYNRVATPMEKILNLTSTEGSTFEDSTKYKKLVRSLNFLTTIRPHIDSIVGILSRLMHQPCEGHLNSTKQVLKYLKGTQTYVIKYSKVVDFHITIYSYSDFDEDKKNEVSTSCYLMRLGLESISWRSHKQYVLVDSTTEAKYVATTQDIRENIWLHKILKDLQEKKKSSSLILIDSRFTIQLAKNPKFHDRSKHINTKYHFIRHYL
eukprot:PITA_30552